MIDAQFFHFLVLLKNYDGRRLKHKLEFLCGQCCSHLAHTELVYNFWLESSLSFHFSVQLFRLVTLATGKGIVISEVFRCYYYHSWVLCAELCFLSTTTLRWNTHWLPKLHLLEGLGCFIACCKLFFCILVWCTDYHLRPIRSCKVYCIWRNIVWYLVDN